MRLSFEGSKLLILSKENELGQTAVRGSFPFGSTSKIKIGCGQWNAQKPPAKVAKENRETDFTQCWAAASDGL